MSASLPPDRFPELEKEILKLNGNEAFNWHNSRSNFIKSQLLHRYPEVNLSKVFHDIAGQYKLV
jgi:hypothetical protein